MAVADVQRALSRALRECEEIHKKIEARLTAGTGSVLEDGGCLALTSIPNLAGQGVLRDDSRLPETARDCPRLPEMTREYPRVPAWQTSTLFAVAAPCKSETPAPTHCPENTHPTASR